MNNLTVHTGILNESILKIVFKGQVFQLTKPIMKSSKYSSQVILWS